MGEPELTAWRPSDPAAALGLAVDYLGRKPAFARLQFGEWSRTLYYQVSRKHYLFVIDRQRAVLGFLGWALTANELAETWIDGRSGLRNDECLTGDIVIINAWAADTPAAQQFLVETGRKLFGEKHSLFFKRYYPNGRWRAMRLSVNPFVGDHLARYAKALEG